MGNSGAGVGSTKAVEVLMDSLAVLHRWRAEIAGLLEIAASATKNAVEADPMLARAVEHLREATGFDSITNKDAHIIRARTCVENAMTLRASDTSLAGLRARLLEHDRKVSSAIEDFEAQIKRAASARQIAVPSSEPHMSLVGMEPDLETLVRPSLRGRVRRLVGSFLHR